MVGSFLLVSFIWFALGTIVGSFFNVILERTLQDEQWLWGRSRCDMCRKTIAWYDNVPLISYFVLQGKCRWCHKKFSLSNPVIELLTGTLFVWWYWGGALFFQLTQAPYQALQPLFWLAVGVLLIMIVVADLLYLLIPDIAVALLIGITIIYRISLVMSGVMQSADLVNTLLVTVCSVITFGLLWLVTKGKGMGLGDVKLMIPLGLLLGWPKTLVALFLAFVLGAGVGIVLILMGKKKFGQVLPFGPFLVLGSVVALVFGEQLMAWYLGLL